MQSATKVAIHHVVVYEPWQVSILMRSTMVAVHCFSAFAIETWMDERCNTLNKCAQPVDVLKTC